MASCGGFRFFTVHLGFLSGFIWRLENEPPISNRKIITINTSHRSVLLSLSTRPNVASCNQIVTIHPSHQR
jgi:hypothetical protein